MQPTSAVSQWLKLHYFIQFARKGQSDSTEERIRHSVFRFKLMLDVVVSEKVCHFD